MKISDVLINLFESTKYPTIVDANYIYNLVNDIHRNSDDLYDGDLGDRIYKYSKYKLVELPISSLDLDEWSHDVDYVASMAAMDKTSMPPIVYDPDYESIIDGTHRANARAKAGDTTIMAYVGVDDNA